MYFDWRWYKYRDYPLLKMGLLILIFIIPYLFQNVLGSA